ncbi:MAG: aspartate carbamoyltransferase [Acidipropionibacterium acidipropionici]|jgi:aspartate carbamoyltransferase catalytic subunit|uniref:Aspartate carbamoyltransferase n=1 Tax=Acidipropionibacterium acidipropionici (strain ATCC 4875 / DSM 20272 / JCM 6432 / NBRC 12425 / NCIMB 8070 / 4) TaxID=1171373 RepID=K7S146_ACIA4|nr:aspartate carbamoyltransferase [Acidipropionibacterium acidipropionici]AFV91113.1 Aspartate carbamoyltransferase [Acidipropionibacterium acidipropionici ATCC 4875]ALN14815.1 aspartate carbamoyltransferase [Acidipropionibacterium acidipropionici]APZ09432.1 aspartate carbamoyltransferase [Acidipropionibacterium acidipropionici]
MTRTPDEFPPFGPGRHLLSVQQLDSGLLSQIFELAELVDPIAAGTVRCTVLDGAVLGSLFFEPSTRTRLSFESAFLRLGGEVTTTTGFTFSSMAKGESIHDTSRVVSGYSDVMVVRHPDKGSVAEFAEASVVPVINAGDGDGEHPSQALLDLYTLTRELEARGKTIDGATVAIVGDLKYGRTVHSLMKLLTLASGITFRLFSPASLELPLEIENYVAERGHRIIECDSAGDAVAGADAVYATRVQRERMTEEVLATANVSGNLLNRQILHDAGSEDIVIMHPLPRDSRHDSFDLSADVDDLPGLSIFHQTDNGLRIRMAIFLVAMGCSAEAVKAATKNQSWNAALDWD